MRSYYESSMSAWINQGLTAKEIKEGRRILEDA